MPTASLQISKTINLNLDRPSYSTIVHAKQYDKTSRIVIANLYNGSTYWTVPTLSSNLIAVVRFLKPDGKMGVYDKIEERSGSTTTFVNAVTRLSSSQIQIVLAEQLLSAPGDVRVEVSFYSETTRLSTFSFIVKVEAGTPNDDTLVSTQYFSVLTEEIQALLGAVTHPPTINPTNKNWMLWDESLGQYVDSGYTAAGVSVSQLVKISDPVEWNDPRVYNMLFTDGTSGGTINVYDGVGFSEVTKISDPSAYDDPRVYGVYKQDGELSGYLEVYDGLHVVDTYKSSGTGAPGTEDEYRFVLNDGSDIDGFSVWNGRDAEQGAFPLTEQEIDEATDGGADEGPDDNVGGI